MDSGSEDEANSSLEGNQEGEKTKGGSMSPVLQMQQRSASPVRNSMREEGFDLVEGGEQECMPKGSCDAVGCFQVPQHSLDLNNMHHDDDVQLLQSSHALWGNALNGTSLRTDSVQAASERSGNASVESLDSAAQNGSASMGSLHCHDRHMHRMTQSEKRMPEGDETMCSLIMAHLLSRQYGARFSRPVDSQVSGYEHYRSVIRRPMDFGLIHKKLREGFYSGLPNFADDVRLICRCASCCVVSLLCVMSPKL